MAKKTSSPNRTGLIPGLVMRAAFVPASVNEEARTVEVQWTTGEKVIRSNWDGQFWEELSLDPKHIRMGRLTSGRAPFLANHDSRSIDSVLGVIESARIGTAVIRFAKDDPAADAAWNKVRQGILPNVSVGYRVHKFVKVEGGDDKTPTYRAEDWEPFEVSLVPMGADSAAHVRSAAETHPCTFISRSMEITMTPEEIAAAEALATEKRNLELKQAADAAVKADRERTNAIRAACRAVKLDTAEADKFIASPSTVDQVRAQLLERLATETDEVKTDNHVRIEVGEESSEKQTRGMSAWLFEKMGTRTLVQAGVASGQVEKTEFDGAEFRGAALSDLARIFLQSKGVKVRSYDRVKLFEQAFNYRAGYATTSDFAVLFENVLYKTLMSAYATTPDVWREFCKVMSVQDYRASNFFMSGSFGTIGSLNEHGEFQNLSIPDGEKKSVTTATRGNIIGLSREAIVNDDMGALSDLTQKLGRAMARAIEVDVFALLAQNSGAGPTQTDAAAFFHANRANLGSASANGVAGWDADRVIMASQRDLSSNDYLALRPKTLVVAVGKGTEARVLNNSTVKVGGSNAEPNAVSGLFQKVIDTPRVAGTKRYMFCDPNEAAAIAVVFLNGQESPTLESEDGWRIDGTEWKIRHDFKAQMFDPKGALYNPGA